MIDALTTNETTFFSDIEPFEMLRKEVLPQLMELRRARAEAEHLVCGLLDGPGAVLGLHADS